jgi:hypothetical protein
MITMRCFFSSATFTCAAETKRPSRSVNFGVPPRGLITIGRSSGTSAEVGGGVSPRPASFPSQATMSSISLSGSVLPKAGIGVGGRPLTMA